VKKPGRDIQKAKAACPSYGNAGNAFFMKPADEKRIAAKLAKIMTLFFSLASPAVGIKSLQRIFSNLEEGNMNSVSSSSLKSVIGALAIVGTALFASPLAAQQTALAGKKTATTPWLVNCSTAGGSALRCQMSQSIFLVKTKQRILTALVFKKTGTSELMLRVTLPFGIYLPKGVSVTIDNKAPHTYLIETADSNGSYAVIPLNRPLMARLKAGKILAFAVQNLNNKTIKLELPLKGFTKSEAALEKNN